MRRARRGDVSARRAVQHHRSRHGRSSTPQHLPSVADGGHPVSHGVARPASGGRRARGRLRAGVAGDERARSEPAWRGRGGRARGTGGEPDPGRGGRAVGDDRDDAGAAARGGVLVRGVRVGRWTRLQHGWSRRPWRRSLHVPGIAGPTKGKRTGELRSHRREARPPSAQTLPLAHAGGAPCCLTLSGALESRLQAERARTPLRRRTSQRARGRVLRAARRNQRAAKQINEQRAESSEL